MASSKQDALAKLERLREMALDQAVASFQGAQRELADSQAALAECERQLSDLLRQAPPHPNTFEDVSSMQQAEFFRQRHVERVHKQRERVQAAIERDQCFQRNFAQRQEQVKVARAELEVVRRKQAELTRASVRNRLKRDDEAIEELADGLSRDSSGRQSE